VTRSTVKVTCSLQHHTRGESVFIASVFCSSDRGSFVPCSIPRLNATHLGGPAIESCSHVASSRGNQSYQGRRGLPGRDNVITWPNQLTGLICCRLQEPCRWSSGSSDEIS